MDKFRLSVASRWELFVEWTIPLSIYNGLRIYTSLAVSHAFCHTLYMPGGVSCGIYPISSPSLRPRDTL